MSRMICKALTVLSALATFAVGSSAIAQNTEAFDGEAWLAAASTELDSTAWATDYEATALRSKELAGQLNEASGWLNACRESWEDPEFEDDETGLLLLTTIPDERVLVEATCSFGAYQGESALVVVDDFSATLLRFPWISEDGKPSEPGAAIHAGWFSFDRIDTGEFDVYLKWRGVGGVGMLTTYELLGLSVTPIEARAQSCHVECKDDSCIDPRSWPIIFSKE